MSNQDKKVVCITGASRGLGAAFARAFAEAGAQLVLADRDPTGLDALLEELPAAMSVQCDVSEVREIDNLIDAVIGEFNRLDVMINNAGNAVFGPWLDVQEREFDEILGANIKGAFFGGQAALRAMKDAHAGVIVNVCADTRGWNDAAAYTAASEAVRSLTRSVRDEAAGHGIVVLALVAAGIDTPMWKEQDFLPFPPEVVPSRDFLDPAAVAAFVVSLINQVPVITVPEVVCTPLLATPRFGS